MVLRPKKVWHLCSNRWFSAITEYALSATRAMELQGHSCVFSPLAASPAEQKATALGLKVVPFANFQANQILTLQKLAQKIKPDLIITYGGPEAFLCRFLPTKVKCPVLRFRGEDLSPKHLHFPRALRFGQSHNPLTLTPSEALAQKVKAAGLAEKVYCVPLGLDTQRFYFNTALAEQGHRAFGDARPQLLIVGRLDPIKGHKAFIDLFAALLTTWSRTGGEPLKRPRLHIVGEPANVSVKDLEAYVSAAGLSLGDDVRITAKRLPNIAEVLSSACLGVIPSLGSESICRVAQEFLLCGTPIFVSGVGALEETLFLGAGESYKGKSGLEACNLLLRLCLRSMQESPISRSLRATMAKERFSLNTMGRNLDKAAAGLYAQANPASSRGEAEGSSSSRGEAEGS